MSDVKVNVAVAGATGAVGEVMLEILEERNFPVGEIFLLASERSAGTRLPVGGRSVTVQNLAEFDFSQAQIGLFSAGGSVSAEYAPRAAAAGCVVIDNTSHFRRDEDIPLVVPEVNAEALDGYKARNIIANPNCSTIQMLVALKPIYDAVGIERVDVATYQAVSGGGKRAIEVMAAETARLLNGQGREDNDVFDAQIAFNALPRIGDFLENGYTLEEMKMIWETQKIFADPDIQVNPTCVRIPAFFGHSEAVHIQTRDKISAEAAVSLLSDAPGVQLVNEAVPGGYPTAVGHASGTDPVYVGRIREDLSRERGLNLWIVSDNVRKGAALNSIQIAEILLKHFQ